LVSIPLTTAFANFANQSNSSTVGVTGTATISGQTFNVTGSGTVSESTGSGTFEGVAALQKNTTLTGSITVNGVTAPVADVGITYFSSNYQPLGGSSTDGYCVTTSTNPVPATAKAGDTGFWYAETCYSGISKQTVVGTASISYSVEPDTATTALVKIIGNVTVNGASLPVVTTLRVSNTGAITRLEERTTVAVGSDSITLTITYK